MNNQEKITMGANLAGIVFFSILAILALSTSDVIFAVFASGIACACFGNVILTFLGHVMGWE